MIVETAPLEKIEQSLFIVLWTCGRALDFILVTGSGMWNVHSTAVLSTVALNSRASAGTN